MKKVHTINAFDKIKGPIKKGEEIAVKFHTFSNAWEKIKFYADPENQPLPVRLTLLGCWVLYVYYDLTS